MINNNNLHTDDDFDNFIKEKVDQAGHTDPDDFDLFYQKLESSGFKSSDNKTRRFIWFIIPAALLVSMSVFYFSTRSNSTANNNTETPDTNSSDLPVQNTLINTEEDNSVISSEASRDKTKTINTNTTVTTPNTTTTQEVIADEPGSEAKVQATEQVLVAQKDSVLSPTVPPHAKKYPVKDSVRVRYKLEVDTVIKIDSQKVSRRKWNKNNK